MSARQPSHEVLETVGDMFRRYDTLEIAQRLSMPEHEVYNALGMARELWRRDQEEVERRRQGLLRLWWAREAGLMDAAEYEKRAAAAVEGR